ncbi:hypothetical protein KUTeg_003329 [Tegillarca granosa]|uniref:PiggyBac transposable element-derived protein domain-containing protein n=1 Tax=Tegillarca granosa TaxID=220873 RepID=A0ABQ9FRC6_TEGGR|nr:hypothetical protein KUTeg_003329 [Tegillarca granosa]
MDTDSDLSFSEEGSGVESGNEDVNRQLHNRPWIWVAINDTDRYTRPHHIHDFIQRYGPRNPPTPNASPIEYFRKLTSLEDGTNILDILVTETNRYAGQSLNNADLSHHSRSHEWIDTNVQEMSAFLGLYLAMGLVKKPTIASYWNSENRFSLFQTPSFRNIMTRNRFQLLLQYLHCNDNNTNIPRGNPNHDPAHKVRPILDLINTSFKDSYSLSRDITVDESIVGFKGRNRIVQYVPAKKTHRWGAKLFVLAESDTGFNYHINLYAGKSHTAGRIHPNGLGYEVVMDLVRPLFGKYHHLLVDNYFSSPVLGDDLFQNQMYLTSTVKETRKGMPKSYRTTRVPKGEMVVKQCGPLMAMKYSDRKTVTMLSTFATPIIEVSENGRGVQKLIPNATRVYNKLMGGVDLGDSMIQTYDPDFRSLKMWKRVLVNLLLRIVVNAYIIYKQNRGFRQKMNRFEFTMTLCQELIGNHQVERRVPGRTSTYNRLSDRHFINYIPGTKRRRCKVCEKKSRFYCVDCTVALCVGNCFRRYHTLRFYEE